MKTEILLKAASVIVGAMLLLVGVAGLAYVPVSDCVQLDEHSAIPAGGAFLVLAAVSWVFPFKSVMVWRALACLVFLAMAVPAFYFPSGLDWHKADVISCLT